MRTPAVIVLPRLAVMPFRPPGWPFSLNGEQRADNMLIVKVQREEMNQVCLFIEQELLLIQVPKDTNEQVPVRIRRK